MIFYNSELHRDEILLHIAHSILTGIELDTTSRPSRNDGSPNNVLLTTENEVYSMPPFVFLQLELDALTYAYHRAKSIICECEYLESMFKQKCTIEQEMIDERLKNISQTECNHKSIPAGEHIYKKWCNNED